MQALPFLGVDLSEVTFDLTTLRGNFNQTAFDRPSCSSYSTPTPTSTGTGSTTSTWSRCRSRGSAWGAWWVPRAVADRRLHAGAMPVAGGHMVAFAVEGEVFELVLPFFSVAASAEAFERYLLVGR